VHANGSLSETAESETTDTANDSLTAEMIGRIEKENPALAENPEYQKHVKPYIAGFMSPLISAGFNEDIKEDVTAVLVHDTDINPEQQETVQIAHKLLAKYLGSSVVTVRARLVTKINEVNSYMQSRFGQDSEELPISAVLNVQDRMPVMSLYDIAMRLVYNPGSEKILTGLRAVAMNENNQPFTKDDLIDYLKRGYLCLKPIEPINVNKAIDASKAEVVALRSL